MNSISIFILSIIIVIIVGLYTMASWYIIINGINKFKGAKKRRKKYLPVFLW